MSKKKKNRRLQESIDRLDQSHTDDVKRLEQELVELYEQTIKVYEENETLKKELVYQKQILKNKNTDIDALKERLAELGWMFEEEKDTAEYWHDRAEDQDNSIDMYRDTVDSLKKERNELQDQFDQLILVNIENCNERDIALDTQHYWETQAAVLQSKLDEEQNTSQYWYDVAENRRRLLLDVNNTSDYYEGLDDALLILSKAIEEIKDNDNDST